jgi:GH25 family lysozyme M1 (1,4-beta-N-acetylmuramidase)
VAPVRRPRDVCSCELHPALFSASAAYHFGHPSIDAVAQANYFVNAVNAAGGYTGSNTLQLVLDLEDDDGLAPGDVWAWVQAFLGQVQALTGRPG